VNAPDRTVSREFRDALAALLPGLAANTSYWRMTCHLLFGTLRDVDTDRRALPAELIAAIQGKKFDSHYVAYHFLNAFRQDVLDFKIGDAVFTRDGGGRVRTVESLVLPVAVQALVDAERRNKDLEDRVWMSTGNTWLRKHAVAQRKADREQAQALAEQGGVCGQARLLLDYMNSLPPHRFTSALKHLPEAMAAAERVTDAANQLDLLADIRDHAQPFYKPVEKSVRVFSLRASVLRLHRDLRQIMTQDWITADLRSAQLAIVAAIWRVPSITEYLRSGKSVWPDLCEHMGLMYTHENKAVMKSTLYALIFGAGNNKMRAHLGKHFPNASDAFRRLKAHPVIRGLLLARCRQLRRIRRDKGATDAFGTWTSLVRRHVAGYDYQYDNARSILACVAQSYELMLLTPVVRMAVAEQLRDHGFTVTTWLHDGFTFDAHHAADTQDWKDRLSFAIQEEADRLGISTGLEFESN